MKVRIIQILCPLRHCILGIMYESSDGKPCAEQMSMLKETTTGAIEKGLLDPWCGICRSRQWTYEDEATIFKTVEEARRVTKDLEAEQIRVGKLLRLNVN